MTEMTIVEDITTNRCRECNDKLTSWETSGYCIMCEPDEVSEYEDTDEEW
jgi:Zn finger protein HypA/HybF involved in hydrogenase expression